MFFFATFRRRGLRAGQVKVDPFSDFHAFGPKWPDAETFPIRQDVSTSRDWAKTQGVPLAFSHGHPETLTSKRWTRRFHNIATFRRQRTFRRLHSSGTFRRRGFTGCKVKVNPVDGELGGWERLFLFCNVSPSGASGGPGQGVPFSRFRFTRTPMSRRRNVSVFQRRFDVARLGEKTMGTPLCFPAGTPKP